MTRVSNSLFNPRISVIGVGQDADMSSIDFLAGISGGLRFSVPNPAPEDLLTLGIASAFRDATNATSGHQRVLGTTTTSITTLPTFAVDASASELLVSVLSVSSADPADAITLVTPSATEVAPVSASPQRAVFRVMNPQPGTWGFDVQSGVPGGVGSDPVVFVEAAVRSGCRLTARVDVRADPDKNVDAQLLSLRLQVRAKKRLVLNINGNNAQAVAKTALGRALEFEYELAELASTSVKAL